MHNCFKTLLLFSKAYIRQNEFIVMMTKKGYNKIENGMIPGAWVLVLGRGQIRRSENALFFFLTNLLLYFWTYIRQAKYLYVICSMDDQKSLQKLHVM